jgi:hypothetical protein
MPPGIFRIIFHAEHCARRYPQAIWTMHKRLSAVTVLVATPAEPKRFNRERMIIDYLEPIQWIQRSELGKQVARLPKLVR